MITKKREDGQVMFLLNQISLCLILLFSSSAFANKESTKKVVYLWKDSLIGQAIKVPHPLIALHHNGPHDLPPLLLKPPFLNGKECSHQSDKTLFGQVETILNPNTPLTIKKIFFTISPKKSLYLIRWIMKLLSLMEWHHFRGGANLYYLVEDNQRTYVIDNININPALFYRYLSASGQKAQAVLAQFQQIKQINTKGQFISITLEGYAEYIEKCQYYQSPEELSKQKDIEITEQQKSYDRTLELIQKSTPDHFFKNIEKKGNTIEMQVNKKALALLLLNSSFLSYKAIKI